jgi:FKBP-type peptidyl-prolyl cis-trans isomerase
VPALRGKDYGKTKMRYPDYTETESGLQYKVPFPPSVDFLLECLNNQNIAFIIVMTKLQDLRVGDGPSPKNGDTVVVSYS